MVYFFPGMVLVCKLYKMISGACVALGSREKVLSILPYFFLFSRRFGLDWLLKVKAMKSARHLIIYTIQFVRGFLYFILFLLPWTIMYRAYNHTMILSSHQVLGDEI